MTTQSPDATEQVAEALANAIAMRNGSPPIRNCLALMPPEMAERFRDDARTAIAALPSNATTNASLVERLAALFDRKADGATHNGARNDYHKGFFAGREEAFKEAAEIMRGPLATLRASNPDKEGKRDGRDPDPTKEGIFRYHSCWKCDDGKKPCVTRSGPCEYPHARND